MKITFMQAVAGQPEIAGAWPFPRLAALRGGRPGAPAGGSRQGHSLMGAGFVNGIFAVAGMGAGVNQLQQACHSAHSRPDTNCEWWLKVLEPGR